MLRRVDSGASDSSRGRAERLSYPNMQYHAHTNMPTNIQEMDKQFKHVSLGKDKFYQKRTSLTESEASDISLAYSINRYLTLLLVILSQSSFVTK